MVFCCKIDANQQPSASRTRQDVAAQEFLQSERARENWSATDGMEKKCQSVITKTTRDKTEESMG